MASLGLLAAGIAHELNNPLTYLIYSIEALGSSVPRLVQVVERLRGELGEERSREILGGLADAVGAAELSALAEQLEDAQEGIRRVYDAIRDLRTFSRADDEVLLPVNLNDVIESATALAKTELRFRARLVTDYGQLPPVQANDGRLLQLFLHLLIYAARSIEEGDFEGNEVHIRTWAVGDEVRVELRDSGAGLSVEQRAVIFEPLVGPASPRGASSGLGLALCKTIVESYEGSIEVESSLGEGTCFLVCLPKSRDEQRSTPEEIPNVAATPARRLLVIDDEPAVGRVVAQMLRDDYEVSRCTSGVEAQRVLGGGAAFEVILCDLMMPAITGMDFFAWLRVERPELVPCVVFITGGTFTAKARAFLRTVDNPTVEKPFDRRTLRRVLRARLEVTQ